jgi:hypothetical protein
MDKCCALTVICGAGLRLATVDEMVNLFYNPLGGEQMPTLVSGRWDQQLSLAKMRENSGFFQVRSSFWDSTRLQRHTKDAEIVIKNQNTPLGCCFHRKKSAKCQHTVTRATGRGIMYHVVLWLAFCVVVARQQLFFFRLCLSTDETIESQRKYHYCNSSLKYVRQ